MTIGTLLTLKARTPFGAIDEAPVRYDVTVRTPKVSEVVFNVVVPCETEVASV